MIAKFTRGADRRLGIRFEPETFEEQLLMEKCKVATVDGTTGTVTAPSAGVPRQ